MQEEKQVKNQKKKKTKVMAILLSMILFITTIITGYILYAISLLNNIENTLRLIGAIIFVLIWIIFIIFTQRFIKRKNKKNKKLFFILAILMILYSCLIGFVGYHIYKVYGKLSNVSNYYTVYSASIVTRVDHSASNIKDIGSNSIGILNDSSSIDGYEIPNQIMETQKLTNTLVNYEDYIDMIHDLLDEKIDFIFLPTNYSVLFQNIDGLENLSSQTKVIYTEDKKVKKDTNTAGISIDKPFTVLVMGVDSEKENIAGSSFNGDALMLITFNPKNLNATILSIPRDTYVPIACFSNKRKNKITHAAWYGESCMINTIQNFTDIPIDYYVKINFKGVVKLVDALGGIDVDVPIKFCEQDSNRNFNNLICLDKGFQHLDGEQALALSRHRKTINDIIRGQNQQLVISGLMNQLKNIQSLDTVYSLLDTISSNMDTNMSTNDILNFYNIGKDILLKSRDNTDISSILNMQRLYISGYDSYIYDYSTIDNKGMKMRLYNYVPYQKSIAEVTKAMKINLELEDASMDKEFSFDINTPYEEVIIGKGVYNEAAIALLPSFLGDDESVAVKYGQKHGIQVNVNYVTSTNKEYKIGQIIEQSLPESMPIEYINKNKGFTITVVEKIKVDEPPKEFDYTVCTDPEYGDEVKCQLENLVGKDISYLSKWDKKFGIGASGITITKVVLKEGDKGYDASKAGLIVKQSVKAGTPISELTTITITYIDSKEIEEPNPDPDEKPDDDIDENPDKDPDQEPDESEGDSSSDLDSTDSEETE